MAKFLDFSKFQHKEIDKKDLPDNCFFICQTVDFLNPFEDWDYAVAWREDGKSKAIGKFKTLESAQIFASAC